MKNGAYVINLNEYKSIRTHWIALQVNDNNVQCFDSFRVECVPKQIKTFIGNKYITTKSFRIQEYDSIMCGYFNFCIGFFNYMMKEKSLFNCPN